MTSVSTPVKKGLLMYSLSHIRPVSCKCSIYVRGRSSSDLCSCLTKTSEKYTRDIVTKFKVARGLLVVGCLEIGCPHASGRSSHDPHMFHAWMLAPSRRERLDNGSGISPSESEDSSAATRSSICSMSASPRAGRALEEAPRPEGMERGAI